LNLQESDHENCHINLFTVHHPHSIFLMLLVDYKNRLELTYLIASRAQDVNRVMLSEIGIITLNASQAWIGEVVRTK
jgi:hypothetical protein